MEYKLAPLSTESPYLEAKERMEQKIKIMKAWLHKGRKCVILSRDTYFGIYVETPLRIETDYGNEDISPQSCVECYNSLSFSGKLDITPYEEDIWYFGMKLHKDKVWNIEEMKIETEKMVDSVIRYEDSFSLLKNALENYQKAMYSIKDSFALR